MAAGAGACGGKWGAAGSGNWGCNQRKDLEEDEDISRFLGCSGGWGERRRRQGDLSWKLHNQIAGGGRGQAVRRAWDVEDGVRRICVGLGVE